MPQLQDKIAIVTGGASGLGAATVRLFVAEGATVVISDIDAEGGERLAQVLGRHARFRRHDVTSADEWEQLFAETLRDFGRVDVLVNNAGIMEPGSIETQTPAQWRRINAVIADGTFFGCQQAVRSMRRTGGGTIVNISSVGSIQGEPYAAAYCAAKGAVEALTRSIAVHCAQSRYRIRCNSIHPGPITTPMVERLRAQRAATRGQEGNAPEDPSRAANYSALPEEVASSVLYLASDASKWVNGERLVIDNSASVTRGTVPPPL